MTVRPTRARILATLALASLLSSFGCNPPQAAAPTPAPVGATGAVASPRSVRRDLPLQPGIRRAYALGARDAVMLDGGISGQLLLRDANGASHGWRGSRNVPLALVGAPR